MDKRSLKLLSCLIVNEAKITNERKIQLVESIKNANEKELIKFLKLNEELLHEIHPKTKTFMSLTGGPTSPSPVGLLYRKIRSMFDVCTKKCGTYEINSIRRQVCMVRCNIASTQAQINALKKTPGGEGKVAKLQSKLTSLQGKLQEYMAHGQKRGTEY